jgi:hypothetical protein
MDHTNLSLRSLDRSRFSLKTGAVLSLLSVGFALTALPTRPSQAATYYNPAPYRSSVEHYEECADELLGTSLEAEETAAACAAALYPKALSSCVTVIDSETELTAEDALFGCRRVRRPHELARCVVGITEISTEGTAPTDVLTYCRRSLLPVRFSNCVVGLTTQVTAFSTTEMMTNCIAATSRPRQVLPNFIPSGQEVPLQPLPGVDATTTAPVYRPAPTTPIPNTTPNTTPVPTTPPPTRSVPALW